MSDLHARLLTEIDVAIVDAIGAQSKLSRGMERLLRALRKVVELHQYEAFADEPGQGFCGHDQRTAGVWPCQTIAAVAEALGVEG